jgi:hypothetical protein
MRALGSAFGVLGMLLVVGVIGYLVVGSGGSSKDGSSTGGYAGSMVKSRDNSRVQTALTSVRQRIQNYQALNNAFPASLEDLGKKDGRPIPELPDGAVWKYDPATGTVDVE